MHASFPRLRKPARTILLITWGIVITLGLGAAIWGRLSGFSLSGDMLLAIILAAGVQVIAFTVLSSRLLWADSLFLLLQYLAMLFLGTLFLMMLMYMGTAIDRPLIDNRLIAADHWLGFDWKAYVAWVDSHAAMARVMAVPYCSMEIEGLALLAALAFLNDPRYLQRFFLAYLFSLGITVAVAILWPAVGGYMFYHLHPAVDGLHNSLILAHQHDLLALRAHQLTHFPATPQGLVTFPSFHATMAILLLWAAWPFRYLRIPSALFNAAMLDATLLEGGHYLTDIMGGAAMALASISMVSRCCLNTRESPLAA